MNKTSLQKIIRKPTAFRDGQVGVVLEVADGSNL